MESTTLKDGLTGEEVMYFTALFCYNWTKSDFEIAFKDSRLGWDYYWNKLQGKIKDGADPADAILSTLTNMDNTHRPMLFEYLFSQKYNEQILKQREWREELAKHMENNIKKHKNKNG